MRILTTFLLLISCLILSKTSFGQDQDELFEKEHLAQLSGAVLAGDSLLPVSYTHIINLTQANGTVSNIDGFFSIIASAGDTILFSNVSYKHAIYIMPDTLTQRYYTLIQMLEPDTALLDEVLLLPWATYEQFKQAVIDVRLPDDDLQRAKRNMAMFKLRTLANNIVNDAGLASDLAINQQQSYLYNAGSYYGEGGTAVLNKLSNPFAWASFIKALKNGEFKNGN